MYKVLRIVALVLAVLGAVWLVRIVLAGDEAIEGSADLQASLLTPFMYIAYATLGIIILFVLFFVLKGLFSDPASLKGTLIGLGSFLAVIVIAYLISSGTEVEMKDGEMLSASGSRWVETGIHAFYIFALIAIATVVWSGIRGFTK